MTAKEQRLALAIQYIEDHGGKEAFIKTWKSHGRAPRIGIKAKWPFLSATSVTAIAALWELPVARALPTKRASAQSKRMQKQNEGMLEELVRLVAARLREQA